MKTIFNCAAVGVVAGSALAYMVLPVFAPGALLIYANMGLVSGALFGLSAKSFNAEADIGILGFVVFGLAALGMSGTTIYKSLRSFDAPIEQALEKAVTENFGNDMHGLTEGRHLPMSVQLLGEESMPLIAKATRDRYVGLYAPDSAGEVQLRFCGWFDVVRLDGTKEAENVQVCSYRGVKPAEIQRLLAP